MAFISRIAHESEEKFLVFEVVIAAHMYDMQVFDKGAAQENSLVTVHSVLFLNEPGCHLRCNEALVVCGEVVRPVSYLYLLLRLSDDL